MQKWILFLMLFVCAGLLIALGFALWGSLNKKKAQDVANKTPNAKELLDLLQREENSLEQLKNFSSIACKFSKQYLQEMDDFDLEFIVILTAHQNVNAKLILEVERHFKNINPTRKTLLDEALSIGLKHR